MKEKAFWELYQKRGFSQQAIKEAVSFVQALEKELHEKGRSLEDAQVDDLRQHIEGLMKKGQNSESRLLALARYFHMAKRNELYIYFTALFGGLGVMESIRNRLAIQEGEIAASQIFESYPDYPLGLDLKEMPKRTQSVMEGLITILPAERYQKALAGNNHGISEESMTREKEYYQTAESLDRYLEERHRRKVEELQMYCDHKEVWFEQEITQEVVEYVKSNQEILSAVCQGNVLYVTKIPYDGIRYLQTKDKTMKSYYACHCPFARESIISENSKVDPAWCYCSAGFAKFPFEVILDRELEVEVLQSALAGDSICRFAIYLPEDLVLEDE